ncbi:MlaD family protein [Patulibacter defluvii]|uniref:MlaD family protein n=1 Tax=Patulibacter defluvii TaxID=3095358 RepID=UPI002A75C324|nr:MlaD family protein [Patulibacter sp. DM4]
MNVHPPSPARIAVMVAFALSCFGLLLYLWTAFGGPTPLRPQGYRVHVSFAEGAQLATESDVRISGVSVGKVKQLDPDKRSGRTETVLEIEPRFAPLPANVRATLRAKTLLGETYVELSGGHRRGAVLRDGGRIADARVRPTVEFDELLRTFDRETRTHMGRWIRSGALALDGRAADLSAALGSFSPFADDLTSLMRVLDQQRQAVRGLVRDSGRAFGALSERQGELAGLIVDGDRLMEITDRRSSALQAAIRALPPFQAEVRRTADRLGRFARDTDPLVRRMLPVAAELTPTLRDLERLAPELRALFVALDPVIAESRRGLPALTRVVDELRPWIAGVEPLLREVNPTLEFLGRYTGELRGFFANPASATHATTKGAGGRRFHYLRQTLPLNPESLAVWPTRLATNRGNAYGNPGWIADPRRMTVFDDRPCTSGAQPGGILSGLLATLVARNAGKEAPPCRVQQPQELGGRRTGFPQVHRDPPATVRPER